MATSVTQLLVIPNDALTLMGKVVGADATATTYVLECRKDDDDCSRMKQTITLGPWAEKALATGAAKTGDLDVWISDKLEDGTPWTFSQHCEMSRSVAQKCTVSQGPVKDSKEYKTEDFPPQTHTDASGLREVYGPTYAYAEVTLTAGLEKLAAATATGSSAEETESTSGQSETSTATADAPGETNGAERSLLSPLAAACAGALAVMALWG
ncbi:hypothetical protein FIE12Z_5940 [Fusarium flagelliforme]|uniref:Uncharacterized protein n=1 Tax=Fusarium flagelliforme TaxID=2675880 RepID=A0A395MPC7_9HYPO|nr:hypothetical protein FIE12Z_5940 [Fusarium flagelliforme]